MQNIFLKRERAKKSEKFFFNIIKETEHCLILKFHGKQYFLELTNSFIHTFVLDMLPNNMNAIIELYHICFTNYFL